MRGLHEAWTGLLHRDAEAGVFDTGGAAAEAEQAASAAQHVEQRDALGDTDRIMPGQHDHRGAKLHALRAAGEIAEQLRRRRRHRVAGEMMLEREYGIEAERLGEIAQFEVLLVDGDIRSGRLGQDAERHADLHGRLLRICRECVRIACTGEGSGHDASFRRAHPSTNTTCEIEYSRLPSSLQAHYGRLLTSGAGPFSPSRNEDIDHQSKLLGTAKVEAISLAQTSASLFADDYDADVTRG